ncbi:hypothetical protein ACFE04_030686 [Oxalis oulophora]
MFYQLDPRNVEDPHEENVILEETEDESRQEIDMSEGANHSGQENLANNENINTPEDSEDVENEGSSSQTSSTDTYDEPIIRRESLSEENSQAHIQSSGLNDSSTIERTPVATLREHTNNGDSGMKIFIFYQQLPRRLDYLLYPNSHMDIYVLLLVVDL